MEREDIRGEPIRDATKRVTDLIQERTGLRLSKVNRTLGKTGGSTDGPSGRRFFSTEMIESIKELLKPQFHVVILTLHKNLSAILR